MVEIISVDIDSLDPYFDPKGNDQLIIRDKVTGKDKRVGVSTLLGSGSGDDFPEWDKDTIFNTTDNKYCIEDDRFWKSLQDGNQNHRPSDDDPETPVWWDELSESVGSAIREWAPGFYRAVDVVVKRNSNLYDLVSPVRPYESVDFEDELAAGDWVMIGKFINPAQRSVLDIQSDGSLDPGETPTTGDRYIITNSGSLHENFGSITGLENNDIVEYNGSGFIVAWDASIGDLGTTAYIATFDTHYVYDVEWNAQGSSIDIGNGLVDNGGTISVGGTLTDPIEWSGDYTYEVLFEGLAEFNMEAAPDDSGDVYAYVFGDSSGLIDIYGQQDADNASYITLNYGITLGTEDNSYLAEIFIYPNRFDISVEDDTVASTFTLEPDTLEIYVGDSSTAGTFSLTIGNGDGSEDYLSIGGNTAELFSTDGNDTGTLSLGPAHALLSIGEAGNISSLSISNSGMIILDDNEIGIQYAADYADNFVDRSLVDKAYVDSLVGTPSLSDGQGTTWNSGDSSVDLGGALTDNVLITGDFNLGLGSAAGHLNILSAYADQIVISSGVNLGTGTEQSANLDLDAAQARLRFRDSDGDLSWIAIHSTGMVVQDNNMSRGLEYVADYSANYIARSLVDKAYVDGIAISTAEITLDQSQILSLNTSPVTIIAAPGAGKVIDIISGTVTNNFNTTAFSGSNYLQVFDSGGSIRMESGAGFMSATAKRTDRLAMDDAGVEMLENTALVAVASNADPTGGSAGSTMTVRINYRVINV